MRVFAALPLPAPAVAAIRGVLDPLALRHPHLRPVRPEGIHVTLHFFGELSEEEVEKLGEIWGHPSLGRPPLPASLGTVGQFPERGSPRVIWVGIDRGARELAAYAAGFQALIAGLGYAPDPRGFNAHITIARNPGERMDPGWRDGLAPLAVEFAFTECVLFHSRLSPRGAVYERLRQVSFGASA